MGTRGPLEEKVMRPELLCTGLAVVAAVGVGIVLAGRIGNTGAPDQKPSAPKKLAAGLIPVVKSDAEWRRILTPEQYGILRHKDTETAFTGKYWNNHRAGVYLCAGCRLPLFRSNTKFESGTGWPSFWAPIDPAAVRTQEDDSIGERREEVLCARCGGHLGHVFNDGPRPTGLRYCMNSGALRFVDSAAKPPAGRTHSKSAAHP